ncbi:MAG: bifunctional 4-hydroxy-2-oxoglutarate aldolase/2-dehydro-3-deoxy-phosphogluconate aldolase [Verrucomicrobiales bacterium]|nr:bifunctional 4-hydroxy-2-oxoglutarate aldolase/2-dehydro-3-deoxy-phosphogluconate aldolase [Verrucomicrobiales bacterium]
MTALTPESEIGRKLAASKILAVLVLDDIESAVPVAEALLSGGVDAMELTLRTPAALSAARKIRENCPDMTVGIGTILTPEQAAEAKDAGAHFGVSPGINPEVMQKAEDIALPFGPGVMTPTDIDRAIREGARLLKFFPAGSSGGLPHLKNIAAPFAHLGLGFIPLGGVNVQNLATYLESDLVTAVGGSWLAPRDAINNRDWNQIEANALEATKIVSN